MNLINKLPLLFVSLFCSSVLSGQNNNYSVYFRSGELNPLVNSNDWESIISSKSNQYGEKHYVCIQFYNIPTNAEKEKIKSYGIELFSYMPRYTYMSAVPKNMSVQTLSKLGVRSIFELNTNQKLHPQLVDEDYPTWALAENEKINVKLLLFSDINLTDAKEKLLQTGHVWDIQLNDFFHQITLQTDITFLDSLATAPYIQFIEPIDPPAAPENYTARTSHRTNILSSSYSAGRHFTGTGIKIAMGDDGIIGPHIDYEGRIGSVHVTKNTGDHGDHVAGTIMGAGNLDPRAKGMAPGAEIHVYDVWDAADSSIFSYYNPGISITSISYSNGCNAGYTTRAYNVDQQIRLMPSLMHVFSAGNEGSTDCSYGAGAGWGNVTGGIKIGKNVIAVANLDLIDNLSGSSSRGPASDGRIKPDISAVGSSVYSTVSTNSYDSKSGTSMSCPGTSGTLTALYNAYVAMYDSLPESSLMKAVLLNSADDIGNPGPDFKHGWGRLNARRAIQTLEEGRWFSDSISQVQLNTHQISVPAGTSEFRVMVYWHDYEGTINASMALVNNIDMQVVSPDAIVYNPWVLNSNPDPVLLDSNAVRGNDTLNNMEQVSISNPISGTYQIHISGTEIPQGPQKYTIVYEFLDSSIVVTYPIGGEPIAPNDIALVRWDTYGSSGTFDVAYSADSGSTWSNISTGIASNIHYLYWLIPDTVSGNCLIRVSRGNMYDESEAVFSIISTPTNLQVDTACMDYLVLKWDSVSEASSYDVFKLGNMYMDSIGNTSSTHYSLPINNPYLDEEWYAVRARGTNNAIGERCNAIEFNSSGIKNCMLDRDLELTSISSPETIYLGCNATTSTVPVTVIVSNIGKQDIANISINYEVSGNTPVTEVYNNTIASVSVITYTFTQPISISSTGQYDLKVWLSDSATDNLYNDTLNMSFIVFDGTTDPLPFLQDFESFSLCSTSSNCEEDSCILTEGWLNLSNTSLDNVDWRVNEGATPSTNTGPSNDHTLGTSDGKYIYLEATACFDQTASLISPCIDLSNSATPYLSFWYNMFGIDMGELHLDILSEGIWSYDAVVIENNQGSPWAEEIVDLQSYAGKIIALRFIGITGDDYKSDIALDDIGVFDENSSVAPISTPTANVSVWPNPSEGIFYVSVSNNGSAILKMELTDVAGKVIYTSVTKNAKSNYKETVDLNTFAKGLYLLNVEINEQSHYIKINKR